MAEIDAEDAIDLLIDDLEGLNEHVLKATKRRIVRRTPKDTGTAKKSWFINYDGDAGDVGVYSDDIPEKIIALEYGHSAQAPSGFFRRTMAEIPTIINDYIKKLNGTQKSRKGVE